MCSYDKVVVTVRSIKYDFYMLHLFCDIFFFVFRSDVTIVKYHISMYSSDSNLVTNGGDMLSSETSFLINI